MIFCRNSYAVKFKVAVVEWQRQNEASVHRTAKERWRSQACSRMVSMLQHIERRNPRSVGKHCRLRRGQPVSRSWPL